MQHIQMMRESVLVDAAVNKPIREHMPGGVKIAFLSVPLCAHSPR